MNWIVFDGVARLAIEYLGGTKITLFYDRSIVGIVGKKLRQRIDAWAYKNVQIIG